MFAEKSKRYVSLAEAELLKSKLDGDIQTVGVFVNKTISDIVWFLDIVDVIQLHGNENDEYIRKLKTITDKPIIQAFNQFVSQRQSAQLNTLQKLTQKKKLKFIMITK